MMSLFLVLGGSDAGPGTLSQKKSLCFWTSETSERAPTPGDDVAACR